MKCFAGREDSEVCLGPHPQDPEGRQAQGAQDLWPFTESKVPGKAKNLFTEMFLSIVVSKFKRAGEVLLLPDNHTELEPRGRAKSAARAPPAG